VDGPGHLDLSEGLIDRLRITIADETEEDEEE
jgi:hypothetical protein